jgi:hypothetical protein
LKDFGIMRTLASVTLCFGLTVGLGGCRHKVQVATLPPVLAPVALEEIPEPQYLPMVEVQQTNLPPVPVVASAAKPKRERKKLAPKAAPVSEPVQMASVAPSPSPEETAIGALTAGGDQAGGCGPDYFEREAVECAGGAKG